MIPERRDSEAGFTLVEVLVALALFALIGVAGLTLISGIIRVEQRTDRRLERLGELQRAMHILKLDFQQFDAEAPLIFDGVGVSIRRHDPSQRDGFVTVRYGLEERTLQRTLSARFGTVRTQTLVTDVSALRWQFFASSQGWSDVWPPQTADRGDPPAAVVAVMTLGDAGNGLRGVLTRVVELPARPAP